MEEHILLQRLATRYALLRRMRETKEPKVILDWMESLLDESLLKAVQFCEIPLNPPVIPCKICGEPADLCWGCGDNHYCPAHLTGDYFMCPECATDSAIEARIIQELEDFETWGQHA